MGWIDLLWTSSDHRILPDDVRGAVFGAVAAAIDRSGGTVRQRFVVELWAAERC